MKTLTPFLLSGAAYIAAVHAQQPPPESIYHYTPDWSTQSWAPVTVYATVTESTTIYTPVPTTVYVTINSTTTSEKDVTIIESFTTTTPTTTTKDVTIIESFTTTTPTTTTKDVTIIESFTTTTPTTTTKDVTIIESFTTTTPTTTTKPVTATEIIKEIITSEVEQVTITLCTSRDTNPTYTAALLPLPSDYTWGCPPGYLCKPVQKDCNFEVGLPSDSYYCSPDECIPATPLPPPELWSPTIYGNASPANDPSLKYNPVGSYFDMNPEDYGLSYGIFVENQVITYTYTTTIIEAPTPTVKARQAETSVPAACYPWCNNCLLEAQSVGKTPALCDSGSAFEVDVTDCEQCIAYHKSDSSGTFVQIAPQFQQFINYCAQITSTSIVSTATSTATSKPIPIIQSSSSTISPPPSTSTSTSLSTSTVVVVPSSSVVTVPTSSVVTVTSTSSLPPRPSSSTVTATLTVAGPTTATVGAQSTPITSTTVTPTTPATWTTTLTFTLTGPTNVSISAYTPDTTHYSTSTLTSTMTIEGPTTITYGSGLAVSAASGSTTSSASAPPATFSGNASPNIPRPNGIWISLFGALGSILACMFWI